MRREGGYQRDVKLSLLVFVVVVVFDLEKKALSLLTLSLPFLSALLAILNLSHENRVNFLNIMTGLGGGFDVRTIPLCGPGCCLFPVHFPEVSQICLIAYEDEWDLAKENGKCLSEV